MRGRVAALAAAVSALTLVAGAGGGLPAAAGDAGAHASGLKRFCKKHPRKPRCQRLRLTVSWDDDANIDLHVWDTSLRHASPFARFAIPRAFHIGDTGRSLPEKFFDRKFTPRRPFAFGICLRQPPAFDPSNFTVTYLRADGNTFVDQDSLFDSGQSVLYLDPDGAADPDPGNTGTWCA